MKTIITVFTLLLSLSTLAYEPKVLEGTYRIVPEWEQLIAYRVEATQSSARIRELREEGYFCNFATGTFYRCKKFIRTELPAQEVEKKFEDLKGLGVNFDQVRSIKQVHQSELFAEYAVQQKVTARNTYSQHRYLASVSQDQMTEKVQFFQGDEFREEFLVEDENTLGLVVTLQKTTGTLTHEVRLLKFKLRR